jgi:hypothetical protein
LAASEGRHRPETQVCLGSFTGGEPAYAFENTRSDCFRSAGQQGELNPIIEDALNRIRGSETVGPRNPWSAVMDGSLRFGQWAAPVNVR